MGIFERRKCKRPECNNTFIPTRKDHVYCCEFCRECDRSRVAREKYVPKALKDPRNCQECNKKFQPKRDAQIYCCSECRRKAEKANAKRLKVEEPKRKPNKSLVEMELEAKKLNMSYGMYDVMLRMKRMERK